MIVEPGVDTQHRTTDKVSVPGSSSAQGAAQPRPPRTFPVVEIFGPTIQGEGPDAGLPCSFVRFGGCDYRCSWCDSMHAVEPEQVRKAQRLSTQDILDRLPNTELVVLSGGNPALLDLDELVRRLHHKGHRIAVETQGSRWKGWMASVERLVVSPKPPSSGMVTPEHDGEVAFFMQQARAELSSSRIALKIVVFNQEDFGWARDFFERYPSLDAYMSAGTPVGEDERTTIVQVRERYRLLCEAVAKDGGMDDVKVLPQLHVIAWGTKLGV